MEASAMPLFDSLTVRGKFALAFGCVLLLLAALDGLVVPKLSGMADVSDQILTYRVSGVRHSARGVDIAARIRIRVPQPYDRRSHPIIPKPLAAMVRELVRGLVGMQARSLARSISTPQES
jgi:hypothetical protein